MHRRLGTLITSRSSSHLLSHSYNSRTAAAAAASSLTHKGEKILVATQPIPRLNLERGLLGPRAVPTTRRGYWSYPSWKAAYYNTTTKTRTTARNESFFINSLGQVRMSSTTEKITNWVAPGDKTGEFKRQASSFRDWISDEPGARFPPEKGRYHLYVSYACPWAHRTLIARKLKGLEDFISFSAVHWHMGDKGWRFPTPSDTDAEGENVIPDPVPGHEEGYTHLRDVYFSVSPSYTGRFTVPVLFDKRSQTIVNNESSEILRMLNTVFNAHLPHEFASVDLYPERLRREIDDAGEWTYDAINNGVYKSGFATTQDAYERNVRALFDALDRVERILKEGKGPYFFGDTLTETDIRLYVTLIRFDPVYVQHFKCNVRDVRGGYPSIHAWLQNLYWNHPSGAFRDTTNFLHIKNHYTKSHTQINPHSITPIGPVPDILPLGQEVAAVAAAAAVGGVGK
ncbi:glutathione S-transferase [Xylariaceae sp. FL0594]|nr:glutathione S-transferase [Xylariaceae sp. FL0594]